MSSVGQIHRDPGHAHDHVQIGHHVARSDQETGSIARRGQGGILGRELPRRSRRRRQASQVPAQILRHQVPGHEPIVGEHQIVRLAGAHRPEAVDAEGQHGVGDIVAHIVVRSLVVDPHVDFLVIGGACLGPVRFAHQGADLLGRLAADQFSLAGRVHELALGKGQPAAGERHQSAEEPCEASAKRHMPLLVGTPDDGLEGHPGDRAAMRPGADPKKRQKVGDRDRGFGEFPVSGRTNRVGKIWPAIKS